MALPVGELVLANIPARPPAAERLTGPSLDLVPVDPAQHAEPLYRISHGDPDRETLWTYMFMGPFASAAAMRAWLEAIAADRTVVPFTVVKRESGAVVGMCQYINIVPDMRRIELGSIWYAPEHQRTGVNTEATLLLLEHAFDRLGYRRVEWKCDSLNEPSRRAALRLGFQYEGLFRQHMIIRGRNRDTTWFAMTDGDWPAVRERLRARLAR